MKNQVELIIVLIFGFSFLVYLFPFVFVEAAKLESGVTINAPSTTETGICEDQMDNDNDGKIDADDQDCDAGVAGPAAATCGLQIVSGVPINYGQLTVGQVSAQKQVMIKNEGTSPAKIIIKAGNWISDAAPNSTIHNPPEITHVGDDYSNSVLLGYDQKTPLRDVDLYLDGPSGGQSIPLYFQIMAKFQFTGPASGSFHQEVSIDLSC